MDYSLENLARSIAELNSYFLSKECDMKEFKRRLSILAEFHKRLRAEKEDFDANIQEDE